MTKSYNTTVAVRWHRPIVHQGLIKLISKFVTLFIITIYLYAMYGGVFFTAQCTLVQMRGLGIACRPSVCLSGTLVICDHIGWKSWKLIAQTNSPAHSLFAAKRRSTYSQGNIGKFWGD